MVRFLANSDGKVIIMGERDSVKSKNKGGRPKKYETEVLMKLIYKYIHEKNPSNITITDLVKYSGLPIQAWRFNKDIVKEISNINNSIEKISYNISADDVNKLLSISSAEEFVDTNYKNKSKLIRVFQDLIELYQFSANEALKVKELEKENQVLSKEIKVLKEDINYYKEEMKKMAVQSTNVLERKEKNLKDNVLDIKKYSEVNKSFRDLFED